jgi:hypothetical protein
VLPGAVATAAISTDPARGQSVADFYKGKTISVVIGYPPGGGFDATARLLIRHMPRHLPGRPSMIAKNMPGAGSLRAANYLYGVAPKDGTEFGIIGPAVPFGPLWSRDGVSFEATKFNWLGSLDRWTSIAFKIVPGYQGTPDLSLAIERGEVEGRLGWCWDCLKQDKPDWVKDKKITVLLQFAFAKHPELPDAPLVMDLAKNEADRQIMQLAFGNLEMARPFLMPPDVPAERVAALRAAFEATAKDPAFLDEARKLNVPINLARSQEIETLLRDVYATPPPVVERAARIINGEK